MTDKKYTTFTGRIVQEVKDLSEGIEALLAAFDAFGATTKQINFDYLSRSSEVRLGVSFPSPLRKKFGRTVQIAAGHGYKLKEIIDLSNGSSFKPEIQEKDGKWVIKTSSFPPGEEFLIFLKGRVSKAFLDTWIKVNAPTSPQRDSNCDWYWIHAIIKNPARLDEIYETFDVDNVTVAVDVGVERVFSTVMPWKLKKRIEAYRALVASAHSKERDKWIPKSRAFLDAVRMAGPEPLEFVNLAMELSSGDFFRDYVQVDNPAFTLGKMEADAMSQPVPEKVSVQAYSRLSKRNKAEKGKLTFARENYRKKVREIVNERFSKK